jgi:hypothetical protein
MVVVIFFCFYFSVGGVFFFSSEGFSRSEEEGNPVLFLPVV